MCSQRNVWPNFVEFHLADASRFVFGRINNAGLNGIVDFCIGDDIRRHTEGIEKFCLNWRTHHTDRNILDFSHVRYWLVDDQVTDATSTVSQHQDVGTLVNVVDDRLQHVAGKNLTPMASISVKHRWIEQSRQLRKGGHVRRSCHSVVNRQALVHVGDIVFFKTQLAI